MSSDHRKAVPSPEWIYGSGVGPQVKWNFGTDGKLTALALARESGDLIVADQAGTLYRLDRRGQIAAMTRLHAPLIALVWSDDGTSGAGISGEDVIIRFDRELKTISKISLPDICISLAITPFGNHLAAGLANGLNLIFNERKRRIAQFETMKPLSFLEFCTSEPTLFGAAEHGLVCAHDLQGREIWQQKNWSNVGQLSITGDGDLVYLASFGHGVQAIDGDGVSIGSYVLDGTVNLVDVSFEPNRLIVSTIERQLYWLDADGELLWTTQLPDDLVNICCDALGEWCMVGMVNQGVYRLDWGGV